MRAGFLEICGESNYILEQSGQKHYMKGGKPGFYPSIKTVMPHPVPLDLFDPFGLQGKMSPEKKETSLLAEINNGERRQRSGEPRIFHSSRSRLTIACFSLSLQAASR